MKLLFLIYYMNMFCIYFFIISSIIFNLMERFCLLVWNDFDTQMNFRSCGICVSITIPYTQR